MNQPAAKKRLNRYHEIYEQLFENWSISRSEIAETIRMSRTTVLKYLTKMGEHSILKNPYLEVKPAETYKEYVYMMNFDDPLKVFKGLKGFPHVLYNGMTFGSWNTLVITNKLLDFSNLVGFENVVYYGAKFNMYTPRVNFVSWKESFREVDELIEQFAREQKREKERKLAPGLDWDTEEWKLYYAFRYDLRKNRVSTLKKIGLKYWTYKKWIDTLQNHCTVHTEFYPEGYETYTTHLFLFSTDYEESVKTLFSLFPTTSIIREVGSQLLVLAAVPFDVTRRLFCTIYQMIAKGMVEEYSHAVLLFDHKQEW